MIHKLTPRFSAGIFTGLLMTTLPSVSAKATEPNRDFRHIQTVGNSQLQVKADLAELSFAVVIKAKTSAQAKLESDNAIASLIDKLQNMGVSRQQIDSANLMLSADYLYDPNTRENKQIGYQASRQLTLKLTQLDKLNAILDLALTQGVNRIHQLHFGSSQEAELIEKARQLAIQDARVKAQSLAEGFGETLGKIWQIRYLQQRPIQPVSYRMEAAPKANIDASYQQAQISISDSVEVIYRLD